MANSKNDKEEFNSEPVYYCKHCLSLAVGFVPKVEDSEFCLTCGSTEIGVCSIEEWEKLYKERHHGMSYLENNYYNK